MAQTWRASELVAAVAEIHPDAATAAAYTSDWAPLADFEVFLAILQVGTMATDSTVDFKLQVATDSSGTGAANLAGKSITQLTEAGTDSDKIAEINVNATDIPITSAFTHIAMVMTVAVAASDSSAVLLGLLPKYAPASDNDVASVAEIIN